MLQEDARQARTVTAFIVVRLLVEGRRAAGEDDEGDAASGRDGVPQLIGRDPVLAAFVVLEDQDARPGVTGKVEDVVALRFEGLADGVDGAAFDDFHEGAALPPRRLDGVEY